MKVTKKHTSVPKMVRELSEDDSFAAEFEKRLSRRVLIKALAVLRTRANLSQQELADKLGCTQGKVSKLESSNDADIRFGDLIAYTGAVGCEMRLFLVPKGQGMVDQVKLHALVIKRLLDRMVQIAKADGAMSEAVGDFLEEAAINLVRIVKKAAAALPADSAETSTPLEVETPQTDDLDRVA